jgi:hypothetical protein
VNSVRTITDYKVDALENILSKMHPDAEDNLLRRYGVFSLYDLPLEKFDEIIGQWVMTYPR